ncbi:MAG: Flp family type IVb pilin [Rhodospirillales bacterium]|nr:MAG: Flp family type IVb pilin [Rhodospirillales bacterium]
MTFNKITSIIDDDSGATAIEYGLIAALVAVALIGALGTLGGDLGTFFTNISGKLPALPN